MPSSDSQVSLQESPDNHGAVVNIVSWFLLITSSLVVLTRLGTKWAVAKTLHVDDAMVVISQTFGISQVAATSIAVGNGLGRHLDTLTDGNITAFQKSFYAAAVVFVASQAFAKLSVVFFVRILSPIPLHRILTWVLTGATLLWALTSILALVFQCDIPRVWDFLTNQCISRPGLWYYISAANILLDVCLIALPISVVLNLQTRSKRKVITLACFSASRVLTIAAISWQIQQSYNLSDRDDSTFSLWPFVVAMTLAQCLGVITASLPYLKPFLDSLESGLIRSDDILRRANLSKKPNSSYYRSQSRSTPTPALELRDLGAHGMSGATAAITAERGETGAEWDRASESSQRKLIQQTRTWGITRTPAGEAVGVPPVDLEAGGETGVKTAAGS